MLLSVAAVVALAAPPDLAALAESDAIAWVHIADLDGVLARVAASPLAPLLALLLPPADRERLRREGHAALLVTAHGTGPADLTETVSLRAGAAAPGIQAALRRGWTARGFVAAAGRASPPDEAGPAQVERLQRGDVSLLLFRDGGRVGYTTGSGASVSVARSPLAGDGRFVALHRRQPRAALLAAVDVRRGYGMLARSDQAARIAAIIDRLGLLGLTEITAAVELAGETIDSFVRFHLRGRDAGLVAALGDPLPPLGPIALPSGALSITRVAVRPQTLYYALSKLYGYDHALRYGIFVTQLRGIEDRAGVRLDRDVLGDAPRAWTFVRLQLDGRREDVWVAQLHSGAAANALLEVCYPGLALLSPETHLRRVRIDGVPGVVLSGPLTLALAIAGDRLYGARSAAALGWVLRHRGSASLGGARGSGASSGPGGAAPAVLSMVGASAPLVGWLFDSAGLGRSAGREYLQSLGDALGRSRSSATLRRVDGGFALAVETRLGGARTNAPIR